MNAAFQRILDLLFPKNYVCLMCNREAYAPSNQLCDICRSRLHGSSGYNSIEIPQIDGFKWTFLFDSTTQGCIHRLKYGNCKYLGEFLAQFIEIPEDWQIDYIIPVPLHKKRLKKRGYNQAELIANALGKRLNIEVRADILLRVIDTKTQTSRTRTERSQALKGAFNVAGSIEGKHILLIDDVCTTGATLTACAQELIKAKAARIYAATVCYTPKQ